MKLFEYICFINSMNSTATKFAKEFKLLTFYCLIISVVGCKSKQDSDQNHSNFDKKSSNEFYSNGVKQRLTGQHNFQISNFYEGLAKISKDNECRFIDFDGNVILGSDSTWPMYGFSSGFSEGLFHVIDNYGKHLLINPKGEKVLLDIKYTNVGDFSDNRAEVILNEKYGFIDRTGKVVIPLDFDQARPFSEGRGGVKKGDKYGFIDTLGKIIIPFQYDEVGYFYDGLAKVKQNNKYGLIDKSGKVVVDIKYKRISDLHEDFVWYLEDKKWGMMNKSGKIIIKPHYDDFDTFQTRTLFPVQKKRKNSKLIFPVKKQGKWGYVDTQDKVVAPFIYDNEMQFNDDMAAVYVGGKGWGYIDITGKEVIAPQYEFVYGFSEGYSVVEKNNNFNIIINKKGECIINCAEEDLKLKK